MKKLLAPITLLFLLACQPSELERCVEANTEPTPINDFVMKDIKYGQTIKEIASKANNDEAFDILESMSIAVNSFMNSLNPLEKIVNTCVLDMGNPEGLTDSERRELHAQRVASCLVSTAKEVKELQLEIEVENTEKAKSICYSQGIY